MGSAPLFAEIPLGLLGKKPWLVTAKRRWKKRGDPRASYEARCGGPEREAPYRWFPSSRFLRSETAKLQKRRTLFSFSFSSLHPFSWHFLLTPRVYHYFPFDTRCDEEGEFGLIVLRTALLDRTGNETKSHAFLSANRPILQIQRK